jgi:thiol:disulfide interchange protein DsbD
MDTVKKSFGIVMWAGALYFASPHLSTTVTALVASAMLLVTATFAWPADEETDGFWIARSRKLYSVVGVLVGGYLLLGTLVTKGFILPPMAIGGGGGEPVAKAGIAWSTDEAAAMAQAKAQNRPVLIDFTADWCAACKELEHFTYTDPGVIAKSLDMIPVMVDATNSKDPQVKALLDKYDVKGLPTVKFVLPDGVAIEELTVTGFVKADQFLPKMEAALARIEG